MKHFNNLPNETVDKLKEIVATDKRRRPRERAQTLLFSNKGLSAMEIGRIMGLNLDKLYRWWRLFELRGIEALYDKGGGGSKGKIKPEDDEIIKKALANQLTLNGVMAEINGKTKESFSKQTLQRYCKKINYSYKRLRFSPPKEPDKTLYEEKKVESRNMIHSLNKEK